MWLRRTTKGGGMPRRFGRLMRIRPMPVSRSSSFTVGTGAVGGVDAGRGRAVRRGRGPGGVSAGAMFQLGQISAQEHSSPLMVAVIYGNQGWAYFCLGHTEQAMKLFNRMRNEFTALGIAEQTLLQRYWKVGGIRRPLSTTSLPGWNASS